MTRLLLLALVALAACTHPHDVDARYAVSPGAGGAIDVVLNEPSAALTVSIDDHVVVDRKYSRKAHIEGVPVGEVNVRIATGGGCEQGHVETRVVEIEPGSTATIVLPGPEPNHGCMINAGLQTVALSIELVALAVLDVAILHPVKVVAKK